MLNVRPKGNKYLRLTDKINGYLTFLIRVMARSLLIKEEEKEKSLISD